MYLLRPVWTFSISRFCLRQNGAVDIKLGAEQGLFSEVVAISFRFEQWYLGTANVTLQHSGGTSTLQYQS